MKMNEDFLDDLFEEDDEFNDDNNKFIQLLNEYKNTFNDSVPTYLIPETLSLEELCSKIQWCIDNNSNTILDVLNIKLDDSIY